MYLNYKGGRTYSLSSIVKSTVYKLSFIFSAKLQKHQRPKNNNDLLKMHFE